jgi:SAM-dependent methyltransferase
LPQLFRVPVIDHLFSISRIRQAIWQLWYPFLTRRLHGEEVLFLNYAYAENPPLAIPLAPDDEPNRACIQLYHHVATQAELRGKHVLEVSCGHGGGASYLTRSLQPASYTALDLNSAGINFCKRRHRIDRLNFIQGDAGKLPFRADAFDAVINVEASHCYPQFPKFLAEVARVLRPGGNFLYADFRFRERWTEWEQALAAAPLKMLRTKNINAEVRRGLEQNSLRSQTLIARHLPKFLHSLGRDFAGTKGSRIHRALVSGELSYHSYCFAKAPPAAAP